MTGALISFSCTAGAILGKATESMRTHLSAYAHDLGLAFQIVDDLLDVEGSAEQLGKTPGKDAAAGFKRFYKGKIADEVYVKLGQLDFAAELAQLRAAKPEALYVFFPGGMGINFIKQFVAAGLSKDITLLLPGFSADQDIIPAVGEPMLGLMSTAHWALDLNNSANKKFVAEFEKAYKRLPSVYAAQGYDTALILDAAIRSLKGNISDKDALRKAMREVKFDSVRGAFKFNTNQYPIQNYYLREVKKDSQGRLVNVLASTTPIMANHGDAYVQECTMR